MIPSYFSDVEYDSNKMSAQSLINASIRVLNLVFGYNEFSSHCNLLVPMSTGQMGWREPGPKRELEHINYNVSIIWFQYAGVALLVWQ